MNGSNPVEAMGPAGHELQHSTTIFDSGAGRSDSPSDLVRKPATQPRFFAIQLSVTRTAGGLFFSVKNLLLYLARTEGIRFTVLGVADNFRNDDIPSWGEIHVITFPGYFGRRQISPQLLWFSLRKIRPFDVVYLNGIWSFASLIALLALAKGASVVVAPRGMLDDYILRSNSMLKRLFLRTIDGPLLSRAFTCHALTKQEKRCIARATPKAKIIVCPNGVPIPKQIIVPKDKLITRFVYIGRIDPKKGLLELVDALGHLPSNLVGKWSIAIHGWGDTLYKSKLADAIANSDYRDAIQLNGPVYGDKKQVAIESAHFFILPSKSEGLPMAAIEALAYGRPVLATPSCNFDTPVTESEGYISLAEPETWPATLGRSILMSTTEYQRCAQAAYRVAAEHFGVERIAKTMAAIFREAAERKRE